MSAEVTIATTVSDALLEALARLLPQLSASASPPTHAELQALIDDPNTALFVATVNGRIVGSLALVVMRLPTGVKAQIEDVVVDEGARGHGVGEALVRAALGRAAEQGAAFVDLTSNPQRAAANRLYQRLGFDQRETNVYRFNHGAPGRDGATSAPASRL